MKRSVLIIGATSPIARRIAMEFALRGYSLLITAPEEVELKRITQDLMVRCSAEVHPILFDPLQPERSSLFFQQIIARAERLEGVVIAYHECGDQFQATQDYKQAEKIIMLNYLSVCALLTPMANYFENQKKGFMIALTSISGDRGRKNDYVYGSAAGALAIFLQGLRNRLANARVHVMTVKLASQDGSFGDSIVKAWEKGKEIVYLPWIWGPFMNLLYWIPEKIYKNLGT